MAVVHVPHLHPTAARASKAPAPPFVRFLIHYAQMCMVMCGGAFLLAGAFFGGGALLGADLLDSAPVLSAGVLAVSLSVPMVVFMLRMGMDRRATAEMSVAPLVVGAAVLTGYALGSVDKPGLIEIQTSLACPVMLLVMLLRFRTYSQDHARHGHG